jgi:hypothetical protein
MATVTGAMTTTNVLSDQLALDFGDQIALLDPSENPFTLLTRRAAKRRTVATTYSHFEDARKARFDATSAPRRRRSRRSRSPTARTSRSGTSSRTRGPARSSASMASPATTSPSPATSRRPASAPARP